MTLEQRIAHRRAQGVIRQRINEIVAGARPRSELRDHYEDTYFPGDAADAKPFGKPETHHAPRNRGILDSLGLTADTRVLETGCGRGQVVYMLTREYGCVHVTGCDFCTKAVEWCQGAYPGLTFVRCCVSELPFPDAAFDVVLALDVTEHLLPDVYPLALREFLRVLAPNGLCAVLPGVDDTFPEHINVLPPEQVALDMQAAGFAVEPRTALGAAWLLGRKPA